MSKTVMIVEDDELNLRLFNELLLSEGYATITASNASEARAAARTRRPDLILMDIELSDGVSGLDLAAEMRRDGLIGSAPVVAVTAHALRGDEEHARSCGCDGYLTKPISNQGFLDAVRRYA